MACREFWAAIRPSVASIADPGHPIWTWDPVRPVTEVHQVNPGEAGQTSQQIQRRRQVIHRNLVKQVIQVTQVNHISQVNQVKRVDQSSKSAAYRQLLQFGQTLEAQCEHPIVSYRYRLT